MLRLLTGIILSFCLTPLLAQNNDPVLFTVEGEPVTLSEFSYIYEKSNGDKADYSEASVKEYLDLYKNFKLKVRRARDLKIDTISSLQTELQGYYKQLSDSYLLDKEVTIPLAKEIYERKEQDVDISHILVKIDKNATAKDTLVALKKIKAIKELIDTKAKTFEEEAAEMSDDVNTKKKGGRLGFMTAQLPSGYYALENAMYNHKTGEIVGPIRTKMGYHLVKINNKRPARGVIEVAHILIAAKSEVEMKLKEKTAMGLYNNLKKGADFEEMALKYSDDHGTAKKNGYVGFFGIGRYDIHFEDAAFGLKKDGDISKPIQTAAGWHIIKRISKKERPNFSNFSKSIEKRLKESQRYKIKYAQLIHNIMDEFEVKEINASLDKYLSTLDKTFFTYKYKPTQENANDDLLVFNNGQTFKMKDFYTYLEKNSRKRMLKNKQGSPQDIAHQLYDTWVAEMCMHQQELNLANKYPKFKALMREYEEGIYLFEVTKREVWDKAMNDSLALAEFYAKSPKKYYFKDRVEATVFNVKPAGANLIKKINKYAKKHSAQQVMAKFNKKADVISFRTKTYEKGANKDIDNMEWHVGVLSKNHLDEKSKVNQFIKIDKVMQPREKKLDEARGFIIADYQDALEKAWLDNLNKSYTVKINQDVLQSIIK